MDSLIVAVELGLGGKERLTIPPSPRLPFSACPVLTDFQSQSKHSPDFRGPQRRRSSSATDFKFYFLSFLPSLPTSFSSTFQASNFLRSTKRSACSPTHTFLACTSSTFGSAYFGSCPHNHLGLEDRQKSKVGNRK